MKLRYQVIVLCLFMLHSFGSFGQITVKNTSFPVAGDKLKLVTSSNLSSPLNVGNVNGPQTWNFSQLNSGTRNTFDCLRAQDAPEFASFPTADLVIRDENGQNQYIDVSSTKMSVIGLGGQNDFVDIPIKVSYSSSPTYRIAPLTFILTTSSVGRFNLDLGADILPDSFELPIPIDSFRIQLEIQSKGVVDAFGTVNMQNKSVEVLREKVEQITDTKIFAKVPFVGWADLTTLLAGGGGGGLPGGIGDAIGKDTTTIYNFYSETHKEVLVSAEYDIKGVFQQVTFADIGGIISSTKNELVQTPISIYPNPMTNIGSVDVSALPQGNYTVLVNNLEGRVVKVDFVKLSGQKLYNLDIQNLGSGQYIFQIFDKSRQNIASQKFIKN